MQIYYCQSCSKLIAPALVSSGQVKIEEATQPLCLECNAPAAPPSRSGTNTAAASSARRMRSTPVPVRGTPSRGIRIPAPSTATGEPPRVRAPSGRGTSQQNTAFLIGAILTGVLLIALIAVAAGRSPSSRRSVAKKSPSIAETDREENRQNVEQERDFRGPGFLSPPPKKQETKPSFVRGRYVRIELPGNKRILSLAEVEVFSGDENVAPKGTATQSSTDHGGAPARAVDGNKNGTYNNSSVTHTKEEANPWWELDLGGDVDIRKVVVHNRTDDNNALASRLKDFKLKVLDKERKTVWEREKVPAPKPYYVLLPK